MSVEFSEASINNDDLSVASSNDTTLPPPHRNGEAGLHDSIDFIGQGIMSTGIGSSDAGMTRRSSSEAKADPNSNDLMIISTPDLCDTYADNIRVLDPIFTNFGGRQRFAGAVFTLKCFEDSGRLKELASTPGHGRILVVDGGGSKRRSILGEILAMDFADNNWAGVVVFGSVRDVDELSRLPLGVAALGPHPMQAETRGEGQVNVPVSIAGVSIRPGDSLCCDRNGIVVNSMPMIMNTGIDLASIPSQDRNQHSNRQSSNSRQSKATNDTDLLGSIPSGEMT